MTTNNIAQQAIDLINENKQSQLVQAGSLIVQRILDLQASIKAENERIAPLQKELNAIATSVIDDVTVLGTTLPVGDAANENQKTIAKVLATMNKAKQDGITCQSTRIAGAITGCQANIATLQKQVDEQVKKLSELTLNPVTTTQVLG